MPAYGMHREPCIERTGEPVRRSFIAGHVLPWTAGPSVSASPAVGRIPYAAALDSPAIASQQRHRKRPSPMHRSTWFGQRADDSQSRPGHPPERNRQGWAGRRRRPALRSGNNVQLGRLRPLRTRLSMRVPAPMTTSSRCPMRCVHWSSRHVVRYVRTTAGRTWHASFDQRPCVSPSATRPMVLGLLWVSWVDPVALCA
jgi:hypothetical protein